jgi:enterochelin esterase-like enzyme
MSMIVFDGANYEGERVAIEAGKVVAAVSAQVEEGQIGPRTVILFRSEGTEQRAVVRHTVEDVAQAINAVMVF